MVDLDMVKNFVIYFLGYLLYTTKNKNKNLIKYHDLTMDIKIKWISA